MRVGVLYSGGKDSNYALHWAFLQGFDVCCLLTVYPPSDESWMFQYPGLDATVYQAEALGLPRYSWRLGGVGESEALELSVFLGHVLEESGGFEGVVAGALLSDYQRMRIALAAEEHGLRTYTPLWRIDQRRYMEELVEEGFEAMIISVAAYGLPKSIVGRIIDEELLHNLLQWAEKYGLNPAFEGGEAETLVVDAPLFKKRLVVEGRVVETGPYSARLAIEKIALAPKKTRARPA